MEKKQFSVEQIDRIIEMVWEDRTPFDAINVSVWDQRARGYFNDAKQS